MAFHGLFIGIDRYRSPRVNWLTCARRDAEALGALFADTLGESTVILTDESATREAIEREFEHLSRTDADDVVVVTFSGHGTDTHELVTHDFDPSDPAQTAISLDLLVEWFSRIPAKRLVCVLDCCFSGGAGAKLFETGLAPRGLRSADELLIQIAGEGRFILTASSPTEPAYENQKLRHGFLSYYLIEALMGAEEVRQAGQVPVYRLLQFVTERVESAARQIGRPQHPTFRGRLDGNFAWPIFTPGTRFLAMFPDRSRQPASADIASLSNFGLPPELIAAWAGAIPTLNQLQLDAINEFGVLDGQHLLVSAPTSSGKTMVGELAALRGILQHERALFLLPLRALVNDKYEHFQTVYGAFGARTIRATGEITDDIPALMRGQYDICLMTYEKFTALALGSPHILEQVGTVVVDEVQMIADESRGVNLEFLLTLLRMRRRQGVEPQLIALSAVIGDANGFESWLGGRLLRRNERPVPLDEGLLLRDGTFRFIESETHAERSRPIEIHPRWGNGSSQDWVIPLVQKLVQEGKQVIVFREQRGEARGCAGYLARELGLPPASDALEALPDGDLSRASQELRAALSGGVAFHISDLDRDERAVVERYFRRPDSSIRAIAATTTLAMGINTPAEAVVVVGLEHPGPAPTPYSVAEYKNIVGRAGRLGFVDRGFSYLLAENPQQENYLWSRYICGEPEAILSHFVTEKTDPRSLIVRVLAAIERINKKSATVDGVVDFLESSFGVFLQRRHNPSWGWDRGGLAVSLEQLVQSDLVQINDGVCELTELGRFAGESGVEIESILRLVQTLRGISPGQLNDQTLVTAAQLTVELDQVLFPINRKSTQKEPSAWRAELSRQGVEASVIQSLHSYLQDAFQPTLRAKKAVACLLWMTDTPLETIETTMTQFGGGFGGAAGAIRSSASRTVDLLPTVARVYQVLHPDQTAVAQLTRILTRLEIGVPAGAVALAQHLGARLSRADYLSLLRNGLCAIDDLEAAADEAVLRCVSADQGKLRLLRDTVLRIRAEQQTPSALPPIAIYET